MPYISESDYSLNIVREQNTILNVHKNGSVYFFHYPTKTIRTKISYNYFAKNLFKFNTELPDDSIVCYLLDSLNACELISQVQGSLKYRLWIAVERKTPIAINGQLPDNHVALVIFTKHARSFKHARIRIKYTICPSCGLTTKDYGGKKHIYHPYGTLMSDVWRDIKYSDNEDPEAILKRISDLFAIEPYRQLYYYNYKNDNNIYDKLEQCSTLKPLNKKLAIKENIASQLINGNCLEVLKKMPENSVDFVFADPPYNINKKYDGWCDDIQIEEYFTWCDKWIKEIYRVLKPGRTFALLNIPLWIVRHYLFAKNLYQFQDLIVWEGLGLPVRNIMPAHYGILCLSKGCPRHISNYEEKATYEAIDNSAISLREWYCLRQSCVNNRNKYKVTDREPLTNLWWDIHRLKHNSKRVDHPTQLPPNLMKRLIYTFTMKGELVLDPFNGAGTTSLIADLLGRKYFGIELSKSYHNIALTRHHEIVIGLDPFRKRQKTPKAKNSRVQRLKRQKYIVNKKTLQLEVRDIANKIGRRPTKDDVKEHSKYPFEFFENYFIDWGEVCAAVGEKGMQEDPNRNKDAGNKLLFPDYI